jgi:hypothetical protein
MKKYIVLFANTEKCEVNAASLLNAQKAAHKLAVTKKTVVISVSLKDDTQDI